MKKILKIVLITVVVFLTLFGLYRVYQRYYYKGVYESLSNVFLEMNYAEVKSGILPGLADFSKAVDGSQSFRDPDWIIPIGLDAGLSENESLKVIVGFEETFIIEYQQLLSDGRYLYIKYDYNDKKFSQSVEISDSKWSVAYDLASYNILHKDGEKLDLEAYKELSHQSKTGDSIPNFYLTDPNEVLEYLKPHGIDEAWIKEKSHFILYDVVLERWFKNGSQRYSVDNLGDGEIVPLSFSE